jgi:cardiolipin synthase
LLNRTANFRNHRKIVVIDGKVGFLGGYNVGDEYLGKDEKLGHWRDTHLEIDGRAVLGLQLRFILDWNYASREDLEITPDYFPAYLSPPKGASVQIVSGGPDSVWDKVQQSYFKMVTIAQKSIYIQTPYFIPDESIRDALRVAALSGTDVKIMVPKKPDHPFVHWANLSYLGELLDSGVKAYEYKYGFLHAKTIVIDGAVTSIGSANWDIRSFELNFETNAIIYDRDVAVVQQGSFENDLKYCDELTKEEYDRRSWWVKVKEAISRMFSNVL